MKTLLITTESINIGFDQNSSAVKDVSLSVGRGEIVGLAGPSGSGKSLTLWSLIGLTPEGARLSGRIKWYNAKGEPSDILALTDANRLRQQRVRVIPQNPFSSLNPVLTCGRQIAECLDKDSAHQHARPMVEDHLRGLGFADPERIYDAYPFELSGGQLQRVVIAMATIGDPVLLLADEPTTALDVFTQRKVLNTLTAWLRGKETSLLLVSHDQKLLEAYCNRVYFISEGIITGCEVPDGHGSAFDSDIPERVVMEPEVVCRLSDVSVQFTGRSGRKVDALQNASLEIHKHEILGVVGATGSGKSTLGRVLTGLVTPDSGTMTFAQRPLDFRKERGLRKRIQMVFQDPYSALYPHWTVRAYLEEVLQLHHNLRRTEMAEVVVRALAQVGLSADFADRFPRQLSGGERQRVQIARAILVGPEFLICDEITSGLDSAMQDQILDLVSALNRDRGMTCMLISHDLDSVRKYAHRVVVMGEGKIDQIGSARVVFNNPGPAMQRMLEALTAPDPGIA